MSSDSKNLNATNLKFDINNPDDSGRILINKPAGMTSFGVVARVRRILCQKLNKKKVKVGHTGTLDPFATGLLVLLYGKETKNAMSLTKLDKVYEAEIILGKTSSTGDPEGEIFENKVKEIPTFDGVSKVCEKFIGKITQTPPKFSAIKINGKRAYDLAREGKEVEIPSREVEIFNLEILDYNFPVLKIRTHVSSGTYIRTLAEDIGQELNTGAFCQNLHRTKIANFDIKNALELKDLGINN